MKALCFGEILWDVNGETRTLGGAPLNVAGHIRRLGGESAVVSAVGDDELGRMTLEAIDRLGVDRSLVRISEYGTGVAEVTLADGIPSYAFNEPCAWDDITVSDSEMERLGKDHFDAVIYGTLASRSSVSRDTLFKLLDRIDASEFFFDVNIRLSFYSDDLIREGLERATILKMNDDEVPIVASAIGSSEDDIIPSLFSMPRLRRILITRGKHGSDCYERDASFHAGTGSVKVVDTVGAGDSLSAAFLYFLASGQDAGTALSKASLLADYIVTQRGAIPEYDDATRIALGL